MEVLAKDQILNYRTGTLEAVRKDVGVDAQSINDAVDLLQDWLKKQAHFVKKDFSRVYLETMFVSCKGSVERAKQKIDKLCTFKTLLPEFFDIADVKEFKTLNHFIDIAVLPTMTYDYHRVVVINSKSENFDANDLLKWYKYNILQAEYLKRNHYTSGFMIIWDFRESNPLNLATKTNLLELRKMVTVLIEGYAMRLKGAHLLTSSKLIDSLLMLAKQILSSKLLSRIHVHKDLDTVYEYVPKEILPIEYGGEEKPLLKLHEEWTQVVCSEENMEYFNEMKRAATIESCRLNEHFNEHYAGMPGSFRILRVD